MQSVSRTFKSVFRFYMSYIPLFIILALFLGIIAAKYIPSVLEVANYLVEKIVEGIVLLAPIAIFLVLAPSLAKMLKAGKESSFAPFVLVWFGATRVLAGLWAALFTVLILRLPFLYSSDMHGALNLSNLLRENMVILKDLLLKSVFFWSIWIAVAAGIVAYYYKGLHNFMRKASEGIETLGDYIEPLIPVLMLVLGAYIYSLPMTVKTSVSADVLDSISASGAGVLNLFGLKINIISEFGLVWVYILGSVLIGIGCFIWQGAQLALLKLYLRNFSVRDFFKRYWTKVYPLAWSTSSEVVSMPLNMSLIKREYPEVRRTVRKLIVGLGAYLNINGTTMHVILLAGIVAVLVGYKVSFVQLAMAVPIIVLVGYGVPGIPGELVLFAVPVIKILNLPEPIIPLFMALYLALQVGLPDSFRTGANVTDNGIYAVGLNKLYKDRFMGKKNDAGKNLRRGKMNESKCEKKSATLVAP